MELVKIIRGPGIGSPQSLAPSVPGLASESSYRRDGVPSQCFPGKSQCKRHWKSSTAFSVRARSCRGSAGGTSPLVAVLRPRKVADSVFRSAVGRPDDVLTRSRDEIAVGSSVGRDPSTEYVFVFLSSYLPAMAVRGSKFSNRRLDGADVVPIDADQVNWGQQAPNLEPAWCRVPSIRVGDAKQSREDRLNTSDARKGKRCFIYLGITLFCMGSCR